MLRLLLLVVLFYASFSAGAQQFVQTIRGVISDAENQSPIPGVKIVIQNTQNDSTLAIGISDELGNYEINNIPVGRVSVLYSAVGFKSTVVEDAGLSTAQELILNINLVPNVATLEAVEVLGNGMRGEPINRLAIASTVTITPEQISKYAGSIDDPLRVVTAYPGVIAQNSGFNYISVRGNSPVGMLYRLEGVPVANPNHFGEIGTNGGFVTQFSSALLSNSDFYSGVAPAEFGNATSAVFDFRFRNGNNRRREHAFKASVLGLDVATEGPFSKNSKASYLINYRYSTLGILSKVIYLGGVEPSYQDLSFSINLPTKKAGTFKVFGVGGLSNFLLDAKRDSADWEFDGDRVRRVYGTKSGTGGVSYYVPVKGNGFFHAAAAFSYGRNFDNSDYLEEDFNWSLRDQSTYNDARITVTADYNHKFSNRHSNKTGVIYGLSRHQYSAQRYDKNIPGLYTSANTAGNGQQIQAFSQSKIALSDKWTLNAGVHYIHFLLNNKFNVEPRVGLHFEPNLRSKFSLSYGLHSRIENLNFYFIEDQENPGSLINKDLDLMKSLHSSIGYTVMLTKSLKLKTEAYFQYHYDVPAIAGGTYSVQNLFNSLPQVDLTNVGSGKNYGIEFMLQQFTFKGFYYMFSLAIFDAQYRAGDGVWRNNELNQRYSYNVIAGKEFKLKDKPNKSRLLSVNINFRHSGGAWKTPIDLEASEMAGWTVYDESDPFSIQQPDLMGLDISMNYRSSKKKVSTECSITFKNIYSNNAVLFELYDTDTKSIRQREDYGLIPVISYTIHF
ncbi:MAG: TonB-dependent receptor [Crocinitomicaceae bacterium]